MTYLVAADLPATPAGERFRALLARPQILQAPGAHNGQAALQARAELYATIDYAACEALDRSIVQTILPQKGGRE